MKRFLVGIGGKGECPSAWGGKIIYLGSLYRAVNPWNLLAWRKDAPGAHGLVGHALPSRT